MLAKGSVILAVALATILALGAGQPARADPDGAPSFTNARYGEDWSTLKDPANRTGAWWESLKFIPISRESQIYLTLGADLRLRYEGYANNLWGSGRKPDEGYGWPRMLPYADLHLGHDLRLFGQVIGAWADKSPLTKSPVDETGLDLLQGFAEYRFRLEDGASITVQGGRQLVAYGSERLIGMRFGPNVPLAFDGGLARYQSGDWKIDGFFIRPVENNLRDFDDRTDGGRRAGGVYATRALPELGTGSGLDLYWIGYHRAAARFDQGAGTEDRHTFGTRLFGRLGDWSWNHEAMIQTGTFGRDDILAWSVATDTTYTFSNLPLKPFLELKANVISGDGSRNDRTLGTFNPLFPKGKYFGEIGLVGPYNLVNLHPVAGIALGSGWTLSAAAVFYWRESLSDGVYGNPGNLLRAAGTSRARYIGTQADLVLGWAATQNLSFAVSYSIFEPGRFIAETGPAKTVQFVGTEVQYRF